MTATEELRFRAQLKQEQYYKEVARFDAHGLEALKAFLTLNAGGCVAMLGFMQALISKGGAFTIFKPYGSTALVCFAAGIIFAALLPIVRMLDSHNSIDVILNRAPGHDRWGHVTSALWCLAGAGFIAGLIAVGFGISNLEIQDSPGPENTLTKSTPSPQRSRSSIASYLRQGARPVVGSSTGLGYLG